MARKPSGRKKAVKKGLRERAPYREWLKSEDVRNLRIDLNKKIGDGYFGNVFLGKLYFKGARPRTVAIKKFKKYASMNDKKAAQYQECIQRLVEAGLPLPKMAMVKWEGEWYQVSQAFYRPGKKGIVSSIIRRGKKSTVSKIENQRDVASLLEDAEYRKEFVEIVARTLNAGYVPWPDYVETLIKKSIIPLDLDWVAVMRDESHQEKVRIMANFFGMCDLQYLPQRLKLIDQIRRKITDTKATKVYDEAVEEFQRRTQR